MIGTVKAQAHFALAAFVALALAGCDDHAKKADATPQLPSVTVAAPMPRKVTDWDEYTGRFVAIQSVQLRARVSGYLEEIKFADGQLVKKGDLLFVIDPRPFRAALDQASADRKREISRQELAASELTRASKLLEAHAISQEEYDTRLQASRESEASVASAAAAVETARLNLEFTEIRAPFSGRISDRKIDVGNLVSGGNSDATLLASIVSQDPIYFEFEASEGDYLRYVRLSQTGTRPSSRDTPNQVFVRLMDENRWSHSGKMSFVDNQLDANSGTVRGRATLSNPDATFQPGMFGRLRLLGSGDYDALLLPDEAITSDQATKMVMVVAEDGTVAPPQVQLGPRIDGLRVIRAGVAPTDKVIISGLNRARPGQKVSPQSGSFKAVPDEG